DVLATPNLNGDYLSDAVAAEVGGMGIAPGANIADHVAVFEATHGTAPKYANQNKVNPGSLLFSGVMMLEYMGWNEAADLITLAYPEVIKDGIVTYDFARQIDGANQWGILPRRDIVTKIVKGGKNPASTKVKDIASRPVMSVPAEMSIRDAAKILSEKNFSRLTVAQGDKVIGIVTETDIFNAV